jgi:hypothetical protein
MVNDMNVVETIDPKYFYQSYRHPIYIFHGSKEFVPVLKASQAVCDSGHEPNQQNGVYGSSLFKGAIPYAIKGKDKYNCSIGTGPDDMTMKIYDGVIPEDDYGYIYVCDARGFENRRDDCQFVSYTDVVPIEVIKVYYRDFKDCFVYEGDSHPRGM